MPDLERVINELFIDTAPTPEDKAWIKGYVYGKSYARKEILWVTVILVPLILVGISLFCN